MSLLTKWRLHYNKICDNSNNWLLILASGWPRYRVHKTCLITWLLFSSITLCPHRMSINHPNFLLALMLLNLTTSKVCSCTTFEGNGKFKFVKITRVLVFIDKLWLVANDKDCQVTFSDRSDWCNVLNSSKSKTVKPATGFPEQFPAFLNNLTLCETRKFPSPHSSKVSEHVVTQLL